MLRLPKDKFRSSPLSKSWETVVTQPCYEEATNAALLQMQVTQAHVDERSAHEMAGAKKFLDILSTIHQAPEAAQSKPNPKLDYAAGV